MTTSPSDKPLIIFSHGKESGPYGSKILTLGSKANELGFEYVSIDYQGIDDPDLRIQKLVSYIQDLKIKNFILVGSSMGGYVSVCTAELIKPMAMFLLCPALYLQGYEKADYHPLTDHITLVHGWNDEVVPYQNSITFASTFLSTLHLIDGDHRLTASIDHITTLFEDFLRRVG